MPCLQSTNCGRAACARDLESKSRVDGFCVVSGVALRAARVWAGVSPLSIPVEHMLMSIPAADPSLAISTGSPRCARPLRELTIYSADVERDTNRSHTAPPTLLSGRSGVINSIGTELNRYCATLLYFLSRKEVNNMGGIETLARQSFEGEKACGSHRSGLPCYQRPSCESVRRETK